jgi:hypothetical protein
MRFWFEIVGEYESHLHTHISLIWKESQHKIKGVQQGR